MLPQSHLQAVGSSGPVGSSRSPAAQRRLQALRPALLVRKAVGEADTTQGFLVQKKDTSQRRASAAKPSRKCTAPPRHTG